MFEGGIFNFFFGFDCVLAPHIPEQHSNERWRRNECLRQAVFTRRIIRALAATDEYSSAGCRCTHLFRFVWRERQELPEGEPQRVAVPPSRHQPCIRVLRRREQNVPDFVTHGMAQHYVEWSAGEH